MLLDLVAAVSVNRLRAVVERSFAFEDALDAFDFAAGSDHIGKVVIRNGTA
jgi:NADPH:quinone reductase-like Zn-dependent oxidoreductase